MKIVLASMSQARRRLLEAAGIAVTVDPARIDEEAITDAMLAEGATGAHIAETLAELKALKVSGRHHDALVIGADQLVWHDGRAISKRASLEAARAELEALRGKTHVLPTAVCVAKNGAVIWRHISEPRLTMRAFSDAALADYLARVGETVLRAAGAYEIEGPAIQLFAAIEGDSFTIQGLPLIELLGFLRDHGALPR